MNTASLDRRSVALLGAFDRFNYGDLLFPIIVKNEMAAHSLGTSSEIFSLVESDLSRYGALKSHAIRTLYKPKVLRPSDVVLFAGGGTIGVDWLNMHANLLGTTGNNALYYFKRIFGTALANRFSKNYFGARAPFPWVAGPEDFPVPVSIAYNAVGGSEFAKLSVSVQKQTLGCLEKAAYLSVRDAETKRLFSALEESIPIHLAPDSAVLMSEQFSIGWLEAQASAVIRELVADGSYVCFQSNINYARVNAAGIVETLESLYETYGLPSLLLPIGRYVGLDDVVALRNIKEKLRTPAVLISDDASIWEIMLVIARARLFLGTSLHGNVTSQSFAVPHLGLSEETCKLDHYLSSWDLPEQSNCVRLPDVTNCAGKVFAVAESTRQLKRSELINLAHLNFAKLARACSIEWL